MKKKKRSSHSEESVSQFVTVTLGARSSAFRRERSGCHHLFIILCVCVLHACNQCLLDPMIFERLCLPGRPTSIEYSSNTHRTPIERPLNTHRTPIEYQSINFRTPIGRPSNAHRATGARCISESGLCRPLKTINLIWDLSKTRITR